jgi:hypothetical protein
MPAVTSSNQWCSARTGFTSVTCDEECARVDDGNRATTFPREESGAGDRTDEPDALTEGLQESVGIAEQFLGQHLAQQRGFSRAEDAVCQPVQDHHEVDEPYLAAAVHQEEQQDTCAEREVGCHQQWLLFHAVDEHAGRGRQHRRCAEREEREAR